jgi:hypothetical protein
MALTFGCGRREPSGGQLLANDEPPLWHELGGLSFSALLNSTVLLTRMSARVEYLRSNDNHDQVRGVHTLSAGDKRLNSCE